MNKKNAAIYKFPASQDDRSTVLSKIYSIKKLVNDIPDKPVRLDLVQAINLISSSYIARFLAED